jgi:hypothetical protein
MPGLIASFVSGGFQPEYCILETSAATMGYLRAQQSCVDVTEVCSVHRNSCLWLGQLCAAKGAAPLDMVHSNHRRCETLFSYIHGRFGPRPRTQDLASRPKKTACACETCKFHTDWLRTFPVPDFRNGAMPDASDSAKRALLSHNPSIFRSPQIVHRYRAFVQTIG